MTRHSALSRRSLLGLMAAGGTAAMLAPGFSPAQSAELARSAEPGLRRIPSTGEMVPAVGLGTWITFNVGRDKAAKDSCADVMAAFFAGGGRMIDSSPMYGSSQETIGYGLERAGAGGRVFSAEKVWISGGSRGSS